MASLLVAPRELKLAGGRSSTLTVVPRIPDCGVISTDYDSSLVALQTVAHASGAMTITVKPVELATEPVDTVIVIQGEHTEAVQIRVRLPRAS